MVRWSRSERHRSNSNADTVIKEGKEGIQYRKGKTQETALAHTFSSGGSFAATLEGAAGETGATSQPVVMEVTEPDLSATSMVIAAADTRTMEIVGSKKPNAPSLSRRVDPVSKQC